jgi:hypothetical protein
MLTWWDDSRAGRLGLLTRGLPARELVELGPRRFDRRPLRPPTVSGAGQVMLPLDALVVDIFRITPEGRDRHDERPEPVDRLSGIPPSLW